MDETEYAVWEALEPYLETHIHLDLNDVDDSIAFREMVRRIASAASSLRASEDDRQAVATVIDNMVDDYLPVYNADGHIVTSNIAEKVSSLVVGSSARRWQERASLAESSLFRVFGYMRAAAGRVFDRTEEVLNLFEYESSPRLYRMPYQVTIDNKSYRFRTLEEAEVDASDARNDFPDALVSVSQRNSDGDWDRLYASS